MEKWKSSVEDGRKHQTTAKNVPRREKQVKGTKVHVTHVGRNTTIVGIPNAQPWVGNVQNATRKTTLQKYVRRSESTLVTLGTKMALLVEVQTGTPTSTRLGSASTQ